MFNNKKGYVGKSMSVRAKKAYENNEMPMSAWTKEDMIDEIESIISFYELELDLALFRKLTKDQIQNKFMRNSSWHHTGCFYNQTNFYEVHEEWVINTTNEELKKLIQDRKDYLKATKKERAKQAEEAEQRRVEKENKKAYEKELENLRQFSKYKTMTNFKKAIEAGRVNLEELKEKQEQAKIEKKIRTFKSTYGRVRKNLVETENLSPNEAYDLYMENKLQQTIIDEINNNQRAYKF